MNVDKAVAYIMSYKWSGSEPGLSRMRELLRRLGNPENKLKFAHIAGTNGKGSTTAILASALVEAGYITGMYTSPHLYRYNERIQINGVSISDADLARITVEVKITADIMPDHPTEYEILQAVAFIYFAEKHCDITLLEVGMGGRLDSTNVIETSEATVITTIGLDHMAWLGDSIDKISREKSEIIKKGGIVVSHPQDESAEAVIKCRCKEQDAKLYCVNPTDITLIERNLNGQRFRFKNFEDLNIRLHGEHQLINAASAITVLKVLNDKGFKTDAAAVQTGLEKARCPGRFEILMRSPVFIVDSAHNPQGAKVSSECIDALFPDRKIILLSGFLDDKDYGGILDIFLPKSKLFIAVPLLNPRALPSEKSVAYSRKYPVKTIVCDDISSGIEMALQSADKSDIILATGSFSLAAAVRILI